MTIDYFLLEPSRENRLHWVSNQSRRVPFCLRRDDLADRPERGAAPSLTGEGRSADDGLRGVGSPGE